MEILKIVLTIIQLLSGLALIVIIMLQSGKNSGLSGAIGGSSGGNDVYSFKAKSKTWDAKLARMTKWVALAFVLLTFVLNLI